MTAAGDRVAGLRSATGDAVRHSAALLERNQGLRASARNHAAERPVAVTRQGCFNLVGRVDDVRVEARWIDGRLVADDSLLDRAHIVVDLGDRWRRPGMRSAIRATLCGSRLAALLTLMRAMTSVEFVEMGDPPSDGVGPRAG